MTLLAIEALQRIRSGRLTLGFGVHHLRGAAVPLLAKAAGYDWLFIDSEHGAISMQEISQLCLAALSTGIAPIVRVCRGALDEGTRALDNGALGIIIPHVDTPDEARRLVEASGSIPWAIAAPVGCPHNSLSARRPRLRCSGFSTWNFC
jgi:2-keto-3-deoxy-L-rhamnonate aldolase RhmA